MEGWRRSIEIRTLGHQHGAYSELIRSNTELVPRPTVQILLAYQRSVAFKFTRLKPLRLLCLDGNVGSLSHKRHSEPKTQGNAMNDLGQPATGTDRQSC